SRLNRELDIRKMGHAATLDPLAEGLMIIGVGAGTKRLTELTGLDKVYLVEVELGEKTASGDKEGEILSKVVVRPDDVSPERVKEVLGGLTGEVELPVPVYSAVKRDGVPLYARARRGEKVLPPKRIMRVYSLTLLDMYPSAEETSLFLSIEMHVGSGVYVRSIAEEIGERLGLPSTVSR